MSVSFPGTVYELLSCLALVGVMQHSSQVPEDFGSRFLADARRKPLDKILQASGEDLRYPFGF